MVETIQILISEDEKLNFLLLKKLLEKFIKIDFKIIHAINGQEALDFCNSNINLVFMDIEMPIMDGFEVTKIIKEKFPNLPVIMQTAHCSNSHKERAITVGCDGFLPKPIIRKDFESIVNQFIFNA